MPAVVEAMGSRRDGGSDAAPGNDAPRVVTMCLDRLHIAKREVRPARSVERSVPGDVLRQHRGRHAARRGVVRLGRSGDQSATMVFDALFSKYEQ